MAGLGLESKVVVVTGVARQSGIGRACVNKFLENGAKVVGIDRQEIQYQVPGSNFYFLKADIGDQDDVEYVSKFIKGNVAENIHGLVNNAAISNCYLPVDGNERVASWIQYIQVNLTGAFLMSHALEELLEAGDSSIVHISSTRALQSESNTEGYAAAKAGLLGLTHAQAVSMKGKTRVNVVLPGWIDTSGGKEHISNQDHNWHLTERVGRPNDVAEMCLFLLDGQKSGFITGQQFVVDGGVTKRMYYPED
eukprot:TRINITY_DN11320_c0_g1_i1.p2 TRINITY_DN11320_c0_g1~~TRINITY_DN11320_c0_g1_i1.p2  ORF type:complete len:251 (+),score=37.44 TRINITY_DN11320_c0_g1_i1:168-920(+)